MIINWSQNYDALVGVQSTLWTVAYATNTITTLEVDDSLSISDTISKTFSFDRDGSDILTISDTITKSFSSTEILTDTLTISEEHVYTLNVFAATTDTLTVSEIIAYSQSTATAHTDILSIIEQIAFNRITNLDVIETLVPYEDIDSSLTVDISFTSLGNQFTLPTPESVTMFPYNDVPIPHYATPNFSLLTNENYTTMALFHIQFNVTLTERRNLQSYFSYWKTNPFLIQMEQDLWQGYLTTNNEELLRNQFSTDGLTTFPLTLEFEATKAK